MNSIAVEILKYRRTFLKKLFFLIPILPLILTIMIAIISANAKEAIAAHNNTFTWDKLFGLIFNWWPAVFLPISIALLAMMIINTENEGRNFEAQLIHNIVPQKLWINKIIVFAIYMIIPNLCLAIGLTIIGIMLVGGPIPIVDLVWDDLFCWVCLLPLLPLHLILDYLWGHLLNFSVAIMGAFSGMYFAARSFWLFDPWIWGIRVLSPLIGVHPNGTKLMAGDALLNASVVPVGVSLAVGLFVVLTFGSAAIFKKESILK